VRPNWRARALAGPVVIGNMQNLNALVRRANQRARKRDGVQGDAVDRANRHDGNPPRVARNGLDEHR
jgi:hypothetical protein